ncbi:MAG: four-carbon acid sugar kinase family protein, partial [Lachnospiraceae bacterium]|nr:four-carbon acid sugar kinase family protein [Lachnospiraceae bacterium]
MKKLLILADDLTGALDTGIQFAKLGISTQVLRYTETTPFTFPDTISVLVIDTETRPRTSEEAYHIVYELCRQAKALKIPYIYKKTDSALRGNIGSELKAVLDGTAEQTLHFIPAFPAAGRTTKEGIHFWNDTPIHKT